MASQTNINLRGLGDEIARVVLETFDKAAEEAKILASQPVTAEQKATFDIREQILSNVRVMDRLCELHATFKRTGEFEVIVMRHGSKVYGKVVATGESDFNGVHKKASFVFYEGRACKEGVQEALESLLEGTVIELEKSGRGLDDVTPIWAFE